MRQLANAKVKDTCGYLEVDGLQISTNFKYFIHQLTIIPQEDWVDTANAVVDHHFDPHENCGAFCKRKDETEAEIAAINKFYHDVKKDSKLYQALMDIPCKCTTTETNRSRSRHMTPIATSQ
jgi:hypothetical protein